MKNHHSYRPKTASLVSGIPKSVNSADRQGMTQTFWIFPLFADHLALIAIGAYDPREFM